MLYTFNQNEGVRKRPFEDTSTSVIMKSIASPSFKTLFYKEYTVVIKHIVMWNIQDTGTQATQQSATIKEKLETLPALISEIQEFEIGIDFNRSEAAFDIVLYSTFNTRGALTAYLQHPAHCAVAEYVKSVVCSRAVVDYEI